MGCGASLSPTSAAFRICFQAYKSKQAIDVEKLRNALKTSVIKEGDLDKPETEHRWTALDCVALNSLGCSGDKASNCKAAARPGGRATE
mmetsp:Transcript_79598/g.225105  ORF Transcript_79598/g.225105 Transcript_79598/m.225105 type:complete len:89 (-) Transcript_79598:54-320(-)